MTKLYNKSELYFSLAFIVIYIVGASLCDAFSDMLGISKVLTFPFLLVLALILLFWMKNGGLMKKYGLCEPVVSAKKFLFYIPLLILISTNIWFGVKLNFSVLESVLDVLAMLCVGFVEEIIFRGFLFRAMEKDNVKSAIVVSSLTFGIGHIINLFSGGFANLIPSICQVFYAIAVGFLFVIIFYKSGSLIACILTHSLVNALSVFQNINAMQGITEILVSLAIIAISIFYAFYIIRSTKKNNS